MGSALHGNPACGYACEVLLQGIPRRRRLSLADHIAVAVKSAEVAKLISEVQADCAVGNAFGCFARRSLRRTKRRGHAVDFWLPFARLVHGSISSLALRVRHGNLYVFLEVGLLISSAFHRPRAPRRCTKSASDPHKTYFLTDPRTTYCRLSR